MQTLEESAKECAKKYLATIVYNIKFLESKIEEDYERNLKELRRIKVEIENTISILK